MAKTPKSADKPEAAGDDAPAKPARAARKPAAKPAGAGKGAAATKAAKPAKAARPARAAKPAAAAAPTPVTGPVEGGTLKLKALVERVAARSGAKASAAKPVIEAVLAELGESLARGEAFNLPPLGKAKIGRTKEGAKGDTIVIKLKRGGAKKDAAPPLAPADE